MKRPWPSAAIVVVAPLLGAALLAALVVGAVAVGALGPAPSGWATGPGGPGHVVVPAQCRPSPAGGMCVTAVVEGTAAPLPVQAGESFDGVSFLPAGTYGMVVGSRCDGRCSGIVETTSDSGATWSESGTGGVVPSLVQVLSPRAAFVAGGPVARAPLDDGPCGNLLARQQTVPCPALIGSSDGGAHWRHLHVPSGGILAMSFADAAHGYALSSSCRSAWPSSPSSWPPKGCRWDLYATSDGGLEWRAVSAFALPVLSVVATSWGLWATEAVYPKGPSSGGVIAVLHSPDAGRHWAALASVGAALVFGDPMTALQVLPGGEGSLSVFDPSSCAMHGCGAELFASSDGGRTWRPVPTARPGQECGPGGPVVGAMSPSGRLAVFSTVNLGACAGPGAVLAVGGARLGRASVVHAFPFGWAVSQLAWADDNSLVDASGDAILLSTDSGRTWRQVLPAPAPLGGIDFLGSRSGFGFALPDDPGAVLATSDGAASWSELSSVPGRVTGLAFADRREGWLVAETGPFGSPGEPVGVFRTDDGGHHWHETAKVSSPAMESNFRSGGMGPPSIGASGADGTARASVLVGSSLNFGFRMPEPGLSTTSDGGSSWTSVPLPSWPYGLAGSAWASATAGWALVGTFSTSSDNGSTGPRTGSPPRVALLATSDGGRSWARLVTLAAPGNNNGAEVDLLPGLSSLQKGLGWVLRSGLGQSPALKGPVRPALVVTSDGGRSWSEIEIPVEIAGPFGFGGPVSDLGPMAAQVLPGGDDWLLSMARCAPGRTPVGPFAGGSCGQAVVWHSSDGGVRWYTPSSALGR